MIRTFDRKIFLTISILLMLVFCDTYYSIAQTSLQKSSQFAIKTIKQNQIKSGSWRTDFNEDTIPIFRFRVLDAVYTGMIMVDLLRPAEDYFGVDTVLTKSWNFVSSQVDKQTGLLRFFDLFSDMPEDADDTGLYWWLCKNPDSILVQNVLDTLEKNKAENGLYNVWFRPGGLQPHLGHGDNPNPNDCMTNIHVYLMLNKYAPERAKKLRENIVAQNIISDSEYWIYNKWSPWLFYLREADLLQHGFIGDWSIGPEVHDVQGQEVYTEIAKLIRDYRLNRITPEQRDQSRQILMNLAANDFDYFSKNSVLLYHNDLSFFAPRYFWSKDVAYALWLRLYFEYINPQ